MSAGHASGARRPIYLTPFGLYSRYMLGAYLRHTVMVSAALMTIALTIDLWPQVPLVQRRPAAGGVRASRWLARACGCPTCCRLLFPSPPFWVWCGAKAPSPNRASAC